jgi:hypothetical protein
MTWVAIGVLVTLAIGLAILGWTAVKGFSERKKRLELEREIVDILGREEIQLLRHRDFDGFCAKVNKIREEKGQAPVDNEFLAKIQYNLMYALDESDF